MMDDKINHFLKQLGQRLKQARLEPGITQRLNRIELVPNDLS
jgi:hypothetical protein